MNCSNCDGELEFAGASARCTKCPSLFRVEGNELTQVVVQAPGGGFNPEFQALFEEQLGFVPREVPGGATDDESQGSSGGSSTIKWIVRLVIAATLVGVGLKVWSYIKGFI